MPRGINNAALALFVKKLVSIYINKNTKDKVITGPISPVYSNILMAPYSERPVIKIAWLSANIETIVKKTCLSKELIALSADNTPDAIIDAAPIIAAATVGNMPVAIVKIVIKNMMMDLLANFFLCNSV